MDMKLITCARGFLQNKVYLQLRHKDKNGIASWGTLIFSSIGAYGGGE